MQSCTDCKNTVYYSQLVTSRWTTTKDKTFSCIETVASPYQMHDTAQIIAQITAQMHKGIIMDIKLQTIFMKDLIHNVKYLYRHSHNVNRVIFLSA